MMEWFESSDLLRVVRLSLMGLGVFLAYFFAAFSERFLKKKYTPQIAMVGRKVIFYGALGAVLSLILNELGFKLNAILGAAGVAGIAIGFASQTSLSNVISGVFLIGEAPFKVGDIINIEDKTGVVLSIDLLSVKIKSFDNHFIRIPNETLIKAKISNITKFEIRRLDIDLSVAYKSDLRKVLQLLKEVAANNEFCLADPEPLIVIKNFGDSSINILLGVWLAKPDFLNLKNSIFMEIKESFEKAGIEIPFPQRVVHFPESRSP